ncbi:MAG: hypothetical protein ACOY0R_07175 [Chloroflexota bacterium]
MRNFWLNRLEDESGVSGTGMVAEGTQFENGKCVLAWITTQFQSIGIYNSIEEVERIHGHNGKTLVVWAAPTQPAAELSHSDPQKFDHSQIVRNPAKGHPWPNEKLFRAYAKWAQNHKILRLITI